MEVLQTYDGPVVRGFEATGNYHRPIAWRLAEAGFEVRLVHRWRSPEPALPYTTAGTRTIPRMLR